MRGDSLHRPGYYIGAVNVRFVVEKLELGQEFLRALRFPPLLLLRQHAISTFIYMLLLTERSTAKPGNIIKKMTFWQSETIGFRSTSTL